MKSEDSVLIEKIKKGNRRAFRKVFEIYKGQVYSIAYRMSNNRDDALDIVQETFIQVLRSINDWKSNARFSTWLYRIVVNKCIDLKRQQTSRAKLSEVYYEEYSSYKFSNPDAEKAAYGKEIKKAVDNALNNLSEAQRTVFILRHYEGFSLKEIAGIQSCAVGTVKTNLFRAIRNLRKKLKDFR